MTAPNLKQGEPLGYLALVRSNRDFRFLWFGQVVSLLGDWFNLIASASLIGYLTQSGIAVGGLFVVRMLAPFLVSPFAGVAADRYNRKHLLILADIGRAITVLGFLLVREPDQVWLLYVLTAIQLAMSGFFFPARNAILPDLVVRRELGTANALSAATWSVMLAFGAALGGIVAGQFGVYPAFVIDGFSFRPSSSPASSTTMSRPWPRPIKVLPRPYANMLTACVTFGGIKITWPSPCIKAPLPWPSVAPTQWSRSL